MSTLANKTQSKSYSSKPRINPDHPLARKLIFCNVGSHPFVDLTGKCRPTLTGVPTLSTTPDGRGVWIGDQSGSFASYNNFISWSSPRELNSGGDTTLIARGVVKAYNTGGGGYSGMVTYGKTSDVIFSLANSKNNGQSIFEVQNSGGSYQNIISFPPAPGLVHFAGVISGSTQKIQINDVISSTAFTGPPKNGDSSYSIGQGIDWYSADASRVADAVFTYTFVFNCALTDAQLLSFFRDPDQIFIYPEDELLDVLFTLPSGSVGPTITGLQLTASAGSVTERTDDSVTLTGQQLTASAGSVTERTDDSVTLTGQQLTSAAGSISETFSANISIAGIQLTSAAGVVTETTDDSATLTGQQLTASAGTVTETTDDSSTLTGQQLTASAGTVTEQTDDSVTLTGQQLTASAGTVTISGGTLVNVTGQQLTASAGTVTERTDDSATLTGQQLTASAGTVTETSGTVVNVTGLQLTSAAGSISETFTANISIVGVQLAASAGSILASISDSATLTGLQLASAAGSISEAVDDTATLSGQQLTATAGTVSAGGTISTSFSISGLQLTASFGLVSFSISGAVFVRSNSYITTDPEIRRITADPEIRRI